MTNIKTTALTICALGLLSAQSAFAQSNKVTIMVGGMEKIIYLPAKLAESLGYYKAEGLDVELQNEPAGVDAETQLIAGQVQGVVGFYDHTIDMQAAGQNMESVVQFSRAPGEVILVSNKNAPNVKTLGDLKGKTPVALTLCFVGLLESLLTAQLIDEKTDTTSNKNTESQGQGIANIVTGFFGGMAGCAMIGQSMINVTSGGRGRLSTFVAGAFLLVLILLLQSTLVQIPMAALVAVMIMVSISTFDWGSLRTMATHPKGETIVMVATVLVTVLTHDLSKGVLTGVILSAIFFARQVSQLSSVSHADLPNGSRVYKVTGQLFFVSTHDFVHHFDFSHPARQVIIDLSDAHFWDGSAVGALDKVVFKFRQKGIEPELVGINEASATLIERVALHDKEGAVGPSGH